MSSEINKFYSEKALIDSTSNEWRDIFNSMSDMVTIHDRDFNIICANKAAEINLKLPCLASGKVKCFRFYHGASNPPKGCPSCNCLKTGIPTICEIYERHLKKYIEIRALPRFDRENKVAGIIHIVRDITEKKRAEKRLKDSSRQLRNLANHLLKAREQERKKIAREIHDELGQSLSALKMELMLLERHWNQNRNILHNIKSMSDIIYGTINTVHKISSDLRPKLLDDLDLITAIKWHSQKFQEMTGITCQVESQCESFMAYDNHDIDVFRIFQEALTNVHRHAEATFVKISLEITNERKLKLVIADNGKGIMEEKIRDVDSFGITGMRERIGALKGSFEINGIPNKGTRVSAIIPLNGSNRGKHKFSRNRKRTKRDLEVHNMRKDCCFW